MIKVLRTMFSFLRKRDIKTWRAHRKACMKYLPRPMRKPFQNQPAA